MWDVLIIGGGPAGSAAGWHLARAGLRVALWEAERLPREKLCGNLLGLRAWRLLAAMGLAEAVRARVVARSEALLLTSPDGTDLRLDLAQLQPRPVEGALACPREVLDQLLLDAAQRAGVSLCEQRRVTQVQSDDERVIVWGRCAREARTARATARVVIAADGAFSPTARACGWNGARRGYWATRWLLRDFALAPRTVELHLRAACLPGYLWAARHAPEVMEVGAIRWADPQTTAPDMRQSLEQLMTSDHWLGERFRQATPLEPPRSWLIPCDLRGGEVGRGRVLLAGDAAGTADPFTGEGIGQAMLSGQVAAEVVVAWQRRPRRLEALAHAYRARLLAQLSAERRAAWWLWRLSRYPALINWVVRRARHSATLHQQAARLLQHPVNAKQYLFSPRCLASVLWN